MVGLTELCEYLSISTEENLVAFPSEQIVPLLVRGGQPAGKGGLLKPARSTNESSKAAGMGSRLLQLDG